jgi:hypothetical protein
MCCGPVSRPCRTSAAPRATTMACGPRR